MADYSKLTKKELLYTLFARDLMLEERRKENDLQKATINTLIEDHRASQEWYKKQLAETEAQNKRVIEKLDLIVRSNQELEQQLAEKDEEIDNLIKEKTNETISNRKQRV